MTGIKEKLFRTIEQMWSWVPSRANERQTQISKIYADHAFKEPIASGGSPMFWKWTKYIGLGFAGTLAAITIGGALYHAVSTKIEENKYPPIGNMVDVGGYRLHIHSQGEGSPTVVFDSGLGCTSLDWSLVQPELSITTRVVSYDRAGYGWSDESPLERTSENIVKELHTLLHNAGMQGPYILVGHSFGGNNVRLFASEYPDEVAGVVLVDASHEDVPAKMPMPKINKNQLLIMSYTGVMRLFTQSQLLKALAVFPIEVQSAYLSQALSTKLFRTCLKEGEALEKSCAQLKSAGGHLGAKALTVISAGKTINSEGTGYTQEQINAIMEPFELLQQDLVTKSTKGKRIIAKESDHLIPRNQPSIIISAVLEQLNEIRAAEVDQDKDL